MNELFMWTGGIGSIVLALFAIEITNLKSENKKNMADIATLKNAVDDLKAAEEALEARLAAKPVGINPAELDPILSEVQAVTTKISAVQ